MVRRLVGTALSAPVADADDGPGAREQTFVVTDGRRSHVLTVIPVPGRSVPLVMTIGEVPPADVDLWVVRNDVALPLASDPVPHQGMICFAPGTLIATPLGFRPVEALRPGDRVLTRDDGPQPVIWTGGLRLTGARLHVMPHLRPVRLRAGAFGAAAPFRDLIVSPQHRVLVRGAAARALFNTPEVLVAAEDLADGATVAVDRSLREVTYLHLLFDRHQIVCANGVETESFRPDPAAADMLSPTDRAALLAACPSLTGWLAAAHPPARRLLSATEAAILRHDRAA